MKPFSFLSPQSPVSLFCSAEGGGAGGGSPPGTFSPEQVDQIQTITAGLINNTMSARFKSFEKQLHESLGKTIGEQFQQHLSKAPPAKEAPTEDPPTEGKQGKGKGAPQVDNVLVNTLQQQLAEVNRRFEAAERQANEERAKNRNASLRTKLADELARVGITNADAQRIAIGHLVDSRQSVRFDVEGGDENKIVFAQEDGGVVNLDVGLRTWAKSPEAKFFLPSKQVAGAGTRPGGYSPPNGNALALSPQEVEARVWAGVLDDLSK